MPPFDLRRGYWLWPKLHRSIAILHMCFIYVYIYIYTYIYIYEQHAYIYNIIYMCVCQYNKLKYQQSSARRTSSLRTGPAKILQCESCGGFDLLNVTLGVQTLWGSMD